MLSCSILLHPWFLAMSDQVCYLIAIITQLLATILTKSLHGSVQLLTVSLGIKRSIKIDGSCRTLWFTDRNRPLMLEPSYLLFTHHYCCQLELFQKEKCRACAFHGILTGVALPTLSLILIAAKRRKRVGNARLERGGGRRGKCQYNVTF